MKRMLIMAALSLTAAVPASAHDFWMLPSDFQMTAPGAAKIEFLIGHGTEVEPWNLRWDRVVALRSVSDIGVQDQQQTIIPKSDAITGGAVISLIEPGTHILAFESYHSFSDLEAEKFNGYVELEGLTAIAAHREQTDTMKDNGREVYSRRAKAIVQVGATLTDQVLQPIGHTLEIVPLAHPYGLGDDRTLPVQVLFRGKPLEGALIDLTNLNSGEEPMNGVRTDADGKATFFIPAQGAWKLNVIWGVSNPGNKQGEFETIFSSLSFGYGDK